MFSPDISTRTPLAPGDVVYARSWDHCYRILSGAFCRIHYVQWQGKLAAAPLESPHYSSYMIQTLGGRSVSRLIVRTNRLM